MLSASAHPTASNLVQTDFIRIPIHTQIEDIHWPAKEDKAMWAVNGLGGDHRVFGHHYNDGGVVTSEYDHTWEKDVCGASSTSKAMEAGTDEDFAAVSGQFDVISESGSFMSSSDDGDDGEDDNNQRRKQNAEDLMELVRDESSARFVSVSDPMAVESSDGPTSLNMNTSATPTSSDTESTLSSTNNSSSLQRDDHSAVRLQGQTGRKIPTTEGSRLFILADGHGGILASKFFVPRTKAVLSDLLLSQLWDFSLEQHRADFETRAADAFRVIDAEYCATQVARYRTWVDNGSVPSDRPDDDGCALVAVVLHNGWLVNLNVGDSRMTLASRLRRTSAFQKHQESWHPVFTSVDHNMTHPAKVYSIFQAGGHFMSPNHSLIPMNPQHPSIRKDLPYHELANARIYRHASAAVKAVGVSHRRTLNLTGTMGDLLFKIEPAILNPIPDVSFVELEAEHEYVMFLATDGIWDHLMDQAGDTERQNSMVLRVVAAAIESVEDERDANLKEWEMYREAKVVWRRGEAERRKRVKAQKKEAKRVFALEAPVAASGSGSVGKDEDIVIDDNLIGGHGAQGDVAVAAEDDFGMSPIAPNHPSLALGLAVSSLSASSSGLNGLEDDSASEAVGDSASIASSNGSTAVASKERSLDKKNEGHDDEAPTEEGSPSSKQSLRGLDEDVQFDDALEGEDVASSHLLLVSEKDSTSDSQVQDGGMNTFTTQKFAAIPPPTKPAYFDFHEVLEARLRQVTDVFAEREMGKSAEGRIHPTILKNMSNLYWQKQIRSEDAAISSKAASPSFVL
ncbi:hypothetical protein BC830DRAFT_377714 [Chytriomyces sp. MP71]|nr:hypothetical protein BC830DRAFT_377714 [Chytriomyces sp. MP71]